MGTLVEATMRNALLLLVVVVVLEVSNAYNIDRQPFQVERRGYRDPDDPRNLFAAMYGGNFKRSGPTSNLLGEYEHLGAMAHKRGLRDRDDPRNLFRSVYGGILTLRYQRSSTKSRLKITSSPLL